MEKNKKKMTSIIILLSFSNAVELKSKSNEYLLKKPVDFPLGFIPQAPWP